MPRSLSLVPLFALFLMLPLRAVIMDSQYFTTPPTVSNWSTGWSTSGATGWDYVGQVNGASGVYLGNDWVLTAGHVGAGDFILGGTTYDAVSGTAQSITTSLGTADLTLFQISTAPALNPLSLTLHDPTAFSETDPGTQVVMIGYGDQYVETWGANTVTEVNETVDLRPGYPYVTNDFLTDDGTTTYAGLTGINNQSTLIMYDSGGGDFAYDAADGEWILIGINEVTGQYDGSSVSFSGFEQLDTYAPQIQAITGIAVVPEPATWGLFGLGFAAMGLYSRVRFRPRRG